MLENQLENISIDSHQFISFFDIFDEFNISFSKSHIEDYDIKNLVISSKIFDRIFISRSNSNHLFASRIFQNSIYFASKSIVLFYSLDELDISLEIRFWIIISVKFFLTTSTLKSFYLLETRFKNLSTDHSKSISVSCYSDSINTRVRKSINLSTESSISTISYQYLNHSWFLRNFKNYICSSDKSVWLLRHRWWSW